MTSRERLVAAARGGEVDRRPLIVLGGDAPDPAADAIVVPYGEDVAAAVSDAGDRPVLAEVPNCFGISELRGISLNDALAEDPASGSERLDGFENAVRLALQSALAAGADGVVYRLRGAEPALCTPMQYGGYYLERDRALLEEIAEARLNVLWIDAGAEAYLDFVSDLPAHVFAWDVRSTGRDASFLRRLRAGAQASSDPESEIDLVLRVPTESHV